MVASWLWWLGRDASEPVKVVPKATSTSTANLPKTLVSNWPNREAALENNLASASSNGLKTLEITNDLAFHYTLKNLLVTKDSATTTLETYGQALIKALKPLSEPRDNEANLTGQIYDTQDLSGVSKITASKTLHQTLLTSFLKMKVPSDAADLHLTIANDLYLMVKLLANMEKVATEPALALQSAQAYQLASINFYDHLAKLNSYFSSHNISFSDDQALTIPINTQ